MNYREKCEKYCGDGGTCEFCSQVRYHHDCHNVNIDREPTRSNCDLPDWAIPCAWEDDWEEEE